MRLPHLLTVVLGLISLGLHLERPDTRPANRGEALVPAVRKTGKLELSGAEFVVDNYTEVEVDGEVGSFATLPPGAEIVHVVVEGKRVARVIFETKKGK